MLARLSRDNASSRLPSWLSANCQLGLDLRVVAAAGGGLERGDGGLGAALHQQGKAENMQRAGMAGFSSQNFFGDPLRFLGTLRVQCKRRPLQRLAARRRLFLDLQIPAAIPALYRAQCAVERFTTSARHNAASIV